MNKVYRYEVPVDDHWHEIVLTGPVLHVANRHYFNLVEFWALANDHSPATYKFRVFGTGQPIDTYNTKYVGTALNEKGFVWHLFVEI